MSRGQRTVQSSAWRWRVQGTSRLACARQVQSQAGGGLARLRQQIKCTQYVQFLGSARAARSVVVLPAPTDPMGFRKSTRDAKAQSATEEHTNEARGGGGGPGVRRPRAGLGQSPARSKFFRAAMHALLFPGNCTYLLSSEYAQARSGRVIVTRYPRLPTIPR